MERKSVVLEATSEGAERLSDLLTLSYEPMLAWRLDGVIEFWNAGAERLYGFAADEAVGRSSHSLLQTKFPVEFIDLRSRLRNAHYWSGELRHTCKDGHEVIVDSRMQLLGDDTVLEVNRDVTEAKALINERKQFEHALHESEQQHAQAHANCPMVGVNRAHNQFAVKQFIFMAIFGEPFQLLVRPSSFLAR